MHNLLAHAEIKGKVDTAVKASIFGEGDNDHFVGEGIEDDARLEAGNVAVERAKLEARAKF